GRESPEQTSLLESGEGANISRRQALAIDLQRGGTRQPASPQDAEDGLSRSHPSAHPQPHRPGHGSGCTERWQSCNYKRPPQGEGQLMSLMMLARLSPQTNWRVCFLIDEESSGRANKTEGRSLLCMNRKAVGGPCGPWTTGTTWSRVSCGAQQRFSFPQDFF